MTSTEIIKDITSRVKLLREENEDLRKSNLELKYYKIKANEKIKEMELDNYNMGQMIIVLEQAMEDLE